MLNSYNNLGLEKILTALNWYDYLNKCRSAGTHTSFTFFKTILEETMKGKLFLGQIFFQLYARLLLSL